jgi:hypothetical protein
MFENCLYKKKLWHLEALRNPKNQFLIFLNKRDKVKFIKFNRISSEVLFSTLVPCLFFCMYLDGHNSRKAQQVKKLEQKWPACLKWPIISNHL